MIGSPAPRGEFEWIDRLVEVLGAGGGIGDDAAVLEGPGGETWVWTVDTLVEGVHFRFDWLDPHAVGHRALAASLSDLAAMGAAPVGALVTAAGPAETFAARLEGIYAGIAGLAASAGCPVLGGDLARATGALHVTVTALGRVVGGSPLSRAGARPGDEVWLTGRLGGPAAAIALLAAASGAGRDPEVLRAHPAYARFARPSPRLAEIAWLRERADLHAAIDVSDGVSGDAAHVARRSGARLVLEPTRIPVHPGAVQAAVELGADPAEWVLHGGEEFELLLASPPGALGPLAAAFDAALGIPLTRIGDVQAGDGVYTLRDGGSEPLRPRSWDHFASGGRDAAHLSRMGPGTL